MPIWLTIVIGIVGSFVGGLVAHVFLGDRSAFVLALVVAVLLVVAYRRFVQKRGVTGPDARRLPTRGFGAQKRALLSRR